MDEIAQGGLIKNIHKSIKNADIWPHTPVRRRLKKGETVGQTGFWLEIATRSRCVSQVCPVAAKSQADDFTSYEKFSLKAISIRSKLNISKRNFYIITDCVTFKLLELCAENVCYSNQNKVNNLIAITRYILMTFCWKVLLSANSTFRL